MFGRMIATFLTLALAVPALAVDRSTLAGVIVTGAGAGIGAAAGGKKGALWGVGIGATIGGIIIARGEANAENRRVANEAAEAEQLWNSLGCDNGSSPLTGRVVVVVSAASMRFDGGVRYSAYESGVATDAVRSILTRCGARVNASPLFIAQITRALGGYGSRRGEAVELPPYTVVVGAERFQRIEIGSSVNYGAYNRVRREYDYVGRVTVQVLEKSGYPANVEWIASQMGMGRGTVGRYLSQRIGGGLWTTNQRSSTSSFAAVLHGVVSAMAQIQWAPGVEAPPVSQR